MQDDHDDEAAYPIELETTRSGGYNHIWLYEALILQAETKPGKTISVYQTKRYCKYSIFVKNETKRKNLSNRSKYQPK